LIDETKEGSYVMTPAELRAELHNLKTRGEIKRFAQRLTQDPVLAQCFLEIIAPMEHIPTDVPFKKQIRIFLDRSTQAQIRSNPIFVDEGFKCSHCEKDVPIGDVMIRDHCPFCLWGRHLDRIPGDRSAECGGEMKPMSFSVSGGIRWVHYSCMLCRHLFRVRAHPDDVQDL
jgi:hypothetical protein